MFLKRNPYPIENMMFSSIDNIQIFNKLTHLLQKWRQFRQNETQNDEIGCILCLQKDF